MTEIPVALQAEQAVIGGLMVSPSAFSQISDWLTAADFYDGMHRDIFTAISEMASADEGVDYITVSERIGMDSDGLAYLIELNKNSPGAGNIIGHAELVREKATLRRLADIGRGLTADALSGGVKSAAQIAQEAATRVGELGGYRVGGLMAAKDALRQLWMAFQERLDAGPSLRGIPTPWADYNALTKGLRNGVFYLLAGRPSMGKSIAGGQVASFSALRGVNTAFFSLEMGAEELSQRNLSAVSGVPHDWLDSPNDTDDNWSRLSAAMAEMVKAPLWVDETPRLTAPQICARAIRQHQKAPLGLVVIDHLHEVKTDGKNRVDELGDAARELKGLAKRLGCPVLCLAQLNRSVAGRTDKRPTMTDLRASGALEEVADVITFIHRPDYYDPEDRPGVVEFITAKGRNIRTGDVHLQNRYDMMRLDDWTGPKPEPKREPASARSRGFGRDYQND